ncbi:MAG: bis(5'-nucleosyl)-tetraphosphatase (symmetrical) [Betaproteobacteria bacterium HGW-Betaproteobacteria-18]|nr:MAG: bis(5'-nucleosyl)-tetraphosphatase (symmetrical) [Betaproteobacteria bacterium HGW-Betaproteobacteria-18]
MALYLIGDVQGCDSALQRLLSKISFSPSRDTLYILGDLVNRGPDSAGVLRRLMGYGAAAQCLLGNHDLHLLAASVGARRPSRKDTLANVLQASDREAMLAWLRQQHMAFLLEHDKHSYLMVHAGVLPSWTATQTMALAGEFETVLRGPDLSDFLHQMYGNTSNRWDDSLTGPERLRVIVNALTRLRFCSAEGAMEFETSDGAHAAPSGYFPWFEVPGRKTSDVTVAFGHWSTLGWLGRDDLLALDSGCVWGGHLSALKLGSAGQAHELIQEKCEQAQKPGQ